VVPFTHDSTNAYLVRSGGGAILVDTGFEQNGARLEADLRAEGIEPGALKAVVLTHAHADHAGGARALQARFGVPVLVGAGDVPMLAAGKNEPLCPVGWMAALRVEGDQAATYQGFTAREVVAAPRSLKDLGFDGEVRPVPGHTKGSLLVIAGPVVLVGDLFRGSLVGSDAETHFYQCDVAQNREDVRRMLTEVGPGAELFYTGHFGEVSRAAVEQAFGPAR
jgi:glyoxylase-like metal-dependent hydrolase (beta-lactamase superfamily II)